MLVSLKPVRKFQKLINVPTKKLIDLNKLITSKNGQRISGQDKR
jgi:hypothetical protein